MNRRSDLMGRDACMILFLQRKIRRRPGPAAGSRLQVEQIGVSISCACLEKLFFLIKKKKNVNSVPGTFGTAKCKTFLPSSIMRRSPWSAARCQAGTSVFLPWFGVPASAHKHKHLFRRRTLLSPPPLSTVASCPAAPQLT